MNKGNKNKLNNLQAVKEKIVAVALDEFNETSYEKATMRSIARRAGISLATIYKCFASKQELAVYLGRGIDEMMFSELQGQLGGVSGIESKIRKITWFFLHYFDNNDKFAWAIYMTLNPVYFLILKEHHTGRKQTELLEIILKEGQRQGSVRKDIDVITARRMYFSLIRELVIVWLYARRSGNPYSLVDYVEPVTHLIYAAVRPEKSAIPANCPYVTE